MIDARLDGGLPETVTRAGPGERFARFAAEYVRHTKGRWAGSPFILEPFQRDFADELFRTGPDGRRLYREAILGIPRKNGKALALDTPIPTPTGWTAMGDLAVGDAVFDESGRACQVTGATDVMLGRPCYRVAFSDGTSIVADAEHRWYVEPRWAKPAIVTTEEMVGRVRLGHRSTHKEHRYRIPVAGPLATPDVHLPVEPYTLGAWLGDGTTAAAQVTVADREVLDAISQDGYRIGHPIGSGTPVYGIGQAERRGAGGSLQATMRREGLIGHKHIPSIYLRASTAQRLALLQGLMDTDGYASPRGQCEFTTTLLELADGVMELVRSLGMKPTVREGRATLAGRDIGPKWRIQFHASMQVFRIPRKAARIDAARQRSAGRYIVAIDPVPSVPVSCIEVDSASHLYLAGEAMVPTHNTMFAAALALYLLIADGEDGPEVYMAAASKKQARIAFDEDKKYIRRSSGLQDFVRPYRDTILCPDNDGKLEVVSSDAPLQHGLNPSGNVIDELHAHKTPDLYDALTSGSGAREQPLTITISTAGVDMQGPLGDIYARMMDRKDLEHPTPYLTIARDLEGGVLFWWYGAPKTAKLDDERMWMGVNPASWITVADLRKEYVKATVRRTTFARLHCNRWTSSEEEWIPSEVFAACRVGQPDPRNWLHGLDPDRPAAVAIDVGLKHDRASITVSQVLDRGPDPSDPTRPSRRTVARTRSWANPFPENHREHGDWELDIAVIRRACRDLYEDFPAPAATNADTKRAHPGPAFVYDPWKFKESAQLLKADGLNMIEMPQYDRYVVPACTTLYELVVTRRLEYDGNPEVEEHVGNAVAEERDRGWRIRKPKKAPNKHIDDAMTLVMSASQAQVPPPRVYEHSPRVAQGF